MFKRIALAAAAVLMIFGINTSASAATVPFSGSIQVILANLPPLGIPGSGIATVNHSGGASGVITHLSLPPSVFASTVNLAIPNAFPIVGLSLAALNNAAVFSAAQPLCGTVHPKVTCANTTLAAKPLHGRSGLGGNALVGIFGTAAAPVANLTVNLAVGGAGSTFNASSFLTITVMLSGAGWTTGTATVFDTLATPVTITQMGGQGPNTAATGREIVLVAPLQVYNNATNGNLPSFLIWRVNLLGTTVPEPGTVLLLASGIAGLGIYGRRKLQG